VHAVLAEQAQRKAHPSRVVDGNPDNSLSATAVDADSRGT
jgi:hypothetical protein